MGALDGCFQKGEIMLKGEGAVGEALAAWVEAFNGAEQEDVGEVGAEGCETRFEDVSGIVVGGDEDDGSLLRERFAEHGASGGERGGEGEGKERGADAGDAFKEGKFAEGDVIAPEPLDGPGVDGGEQTTGQHRFGMGYGCIKAGDGRGRRRGSFLSMRGLEQEMKAFEGSLDGGFAGTFRAHKVGEAGEGALALLAVKVLLGVDEVGGDGVEVGGHG